MTAPISFPADPDPGGRDPVAGDPAAAVAASAARHAELESDTYAQGSTIGDVMSLPPVPEQGGKHTGGDDTGYPA